MCAGQRRLRSPPSSPSRADEPAKRQRDLSSSDTSENPARPTTAIQESLSSAMRVVKAMQMVYVMESIGYCPSRVDVLEKHMMSYREPQEGEIQTRLKLTKADRKRQMDNAGIVAKIATIYSQHANNVASGYLEGSFKLRITREGCGYDNTLVPPTKFRYNNEPYRTDEAKKMLEACLKSWYDNARVSGYGDVQEQVTKVNDQVRHAREIPASEFSVEPELLDRIAGLWDKHFYPNHGVRVQPYKIHLYGPGGHFDVHRDTPQKDLVGTFLLGLGDTCHGGLVVDGKEMPAHEGHWCAFYPDIPHRVSKIYCGYRAVIAFKLFHASAADRSESTTSSEVRQQTMDLVRQLQVPFGIMLERKYCLGTTELSGFDALLYESLRSLGDVNIQHLPVVVTSSAEWGQDDEYEMSCNTAVYPFSQGHIDALADNSDWSDCKWWSYDVPRDHTSCGCPWLEGVKNVPFFAFDIDRSVLPYEDEQRETVNHVGNEAEAWRSDSVYLSYAVIALPKDRKVPSRTDDCCSSEDDASEEQDDEGEDGRSGSDEDSVEGSNNAD
ncbi:hypothetical protein C8Q80DRAFT_1197171 [Daedaleopsis nitida]|nr:hypothetical protein C8Q80DRAFT_1197171 [Daedaleopsis nitida]